jgi:hypothetical protein
MSNFEPKCPVDIIVDEDGIVRAGREFDGVNAKAARLYRVTELLEVRELLAPILLLLRRTTP